MPEGVKSNLTRSIREMQRTSKPWFLSFQPIAASFVFGLVVTTVWFTQFSNNSFNDEILIQEVVSGHVRSMMANHLSDVVSTDQHTVKPWFAGKLDFSPIVKNLAESGFPLIGGRLDYIGSRPVAALNYRHNQHLINVFEWPAGVNENPTPKLIARRGYQLYRWTKNGMNYWAISELNAVELQVFVGLL